MIIYPLPRLDWPNLVGGAILSSLFGGSVVLVQGLYGYYIASRDLSYRIWGRWFSAEFDPKGSVPEGPQDLALSGHNTFLEVRVKRRLGRRVVVKGLRELQGLPQQHATKWTVRGELVPGDMLVGTWRSTVKNTNRRGTALLKFLDYGRAVGYWVGSGPGNNPVFGYWIMSRSQNDVADLADAFLRAAAFKTVDVASFVIRSDPPKTCPARTSTLLRQKLLVLLDSIRHWPGSSDQ